MGTWDSKKTIWRFKEVSQPHGSHLSTEKKWQNIFGLDSSFCLLEIASLGLQINSPWQRKSLEI